MTGQWDSKYETGHEPIDHSHQELFQLIFMLDDAIHSDSMSGVQHIIEFLENYVQEHFKEEEDLMISHDYKEYSYHKHQHELFKTKVIELRKTFDEGINKAHVIFGIRKFVDELVEHVKTVDIGIASIHEGHQ